MFFFLAGFREWRASGIILVTGLGYISLSEHGVMMELKELEQHFTADITLRCCVLRYRHGYTRGVVSDILAYLVSIAKNGLFF